MRRLLAVEGYALHAVCGILRSDPARERGIAVDAAAARMHQEGWQLRRRGHPDEARAPNRTFGAEKLRDAFDGGALHDGGDGNPPAVRALNARHQRDRVERVPAEIEELPVDAHGRDLEDLFPDGRESELDVVPRRDAAARPAVVPV